MMNTDAPNTSGDYGGGRDVSPALDATLDLLADRRRRFVLYHLRGRGAVGLESLAEQVAAWEREADGSVTAPGSSEDRRTDRVLADLHHCQLPRLAEAGVVDYDDEFASLDASDAGPLTEYLDIAAREEDVP